MQVILENENKKNDSRGTNSISAIICIERIS